MAVTKRDIYKALTQLVNEGTIAKSVTFGAGEKAVTVTPEDIVAFATNETELLDKRNKARASKPSKAEAKWAEVIPQIVGAFAENEIFCSAEVSAKTGLTMGEAASVLSRNPDVFENLGKVVKGKSGKVNGFRVIKTED